MTARVVAVAAPARPSPLELAMLEDVVDLVEQMREVDVALAVAPGADDAVREVVWPTTPVLEVPDPADVVGVLDAVAGLGVTEVGVVLADVPVAICPAADGALVAVCAHVPIAPWLRALTVSFDDVDGVERVRLAAPPRSLVVGPGWHRVRSPADAARLDPGLEGWEATRALLDQQR